MHAELIRKAEDIIRQNTGPDAYCVMALMDQDQYPTASTITPSRSEGIRWITFCTGLGSNKTNRIQICSRAAVCFNTNGAYNVTLIGTIEVVTDLAAKQESWYEGLENHFSGADDPHYCVLRFQTERYNLWIGSEGAEGKL